jgi:hypothetical protein
MDFDEETLERIVSIPKLKALKLSHYKIPATVTKLLAKAPLLEEIELDGPIDNNSDDSGLFPLQKHPNLSKISLNYGGQRDDADLIQLVQNSRLESIQVNSSSPIKGTSPMTLIQAQLTAEEHHMRKWDPINDLETQIDQTYFP